MALRASGVRPMPTHVPRAPGMVHRPYDPARPCRRGGASSRKVRRTAPGTAQRQGSHPLSSAPERWSATLPALGHHARTPSRCPGVSWGTCRIKTTPCTFHDLERCGKGRGSTQAPDRSLPPFRPYAALPPEGDKGRSPGRQETGPDRARRRRTDRPPRVLMV